MYNGIPCLEYTGHLDRDGYGMRTIRYGTIRVHRQEWIAVHGPIPDGLLVLHHCDNPACYEMSHLFLGTNADNVVDMIRKGRNSVGEMHYRATLSDEQVRAICDDERSVTEIARAYGVSQAAITSMRLGHTRRSAGGRIHDAKRKLALEDVDAIRADSRNCREIAADYNVHPSHISRVRRGLIWAQKT